MSSLQILKHMVLHRWSSLKTSDFFELRVAAKTLKWLTWLYFLAMFCYMGYMLDVFLREITPKSDSVALVNRYIGVELLLLVAVRFFVQKLPALDMLPYLNLPLRKSRLVRAWLLLSFINWWTILPLAFLLPFWVKIIMQRFTVVESGYWLLGLASLILASNLAVILLKVLFFDKPLKFLLLIFLLGGTFLADKILKLHLAEKASDSLFTQLLSADTPVLLLLIFLLAGFFYGTFRLVRERLYPEAS